MDKFTLDDAFVTISLLAETQQFAIRNEESGIIMVEFESPIADERASLIRKIFTYILPATHTIKIKQ